MTSKNENAVGGKPTATLKSQSNYLPLDFDSQDFDSFSTAVHYAQRHSFAVFPVFGIRKLHGADGKPQLCCSCGIIACSSPGKHPAVSKGLNAASKDPEVLENLWGGRKGLNLAIATGVISGVFVMDIDGDKGRESLVQLESEHGKIPETLTVKTARGHHLYFSYPSKKVSTRSHVWPSIDVRGEGGFVVAPQSRHLNGIIYEWVYEDAPIVEAPQWVLDKVCQTKQAPVVRTELLATAESHEWSPDEVRDMLSYLDPSMGNDEWVQVGMALHSGGHAFGLWDDWSKGGKNYTGDTSKRWSSFKPHGGITMGTLVGMAKLQGWKPKEYVTEPTDWESSPARDWAISLGIYKPAVVEPALAPVMADPLAPHPTPKKGVLPFNPCEDLGLVSETVEWICGTSVLEQPEMALLNTLAALGAIFGRRFASTTDIRTNLYCCCIGASASGKDHSRKMIDKLMTAAGLETFLSGEAIHSGSGLVTQLERKPSHLMMIDEFGMVLSSITGSKAQSYQIDISTKLLNLFTSNDRAWRGGTYSDKKTQATVIHEPNLCIYGTTTLSTYLDALKKIAISSGMMNRFVVLPGRENPVINFEDRSRHVPDYLIEKWRALAPSGIAAINSNIIGKAPKIVEWGTGSKQYFDGLLKRQVEYSREKNSGIEVLFGRYREMTTKIAMIFAISNDIENPRISTEDFAHAENIIKASIFYVRELATDHMYENQHDKNLKDVLSIIRERRSITRSELLRACRAIQKRDMDAILSHLADEGSIDVERGESTGGRAPVVYNYMK